MKDEFDKLIDTAKNLELGAAEKESMKTALLSHTQENPVRIWNDARLNIKRQKSSFNILEALSLRPILLVKNMAIGLIIALLFSGGISFAAENALPGDILYPVKIGINEEVRSALTFDSEAKAHWSSRVVERRLEEAEELIAQGGLSADAREKIETNFEKHAENVREIVAQFETEKNLKAASDIESNFEVSLRAHENILNHIAESKADSGTEMRPIIERVRTNIAESTGSRMRLEANVEARTNGEFKAAAEGKLTAAENKIAEVKRFIEQSKNSVEAETAAEAESELNFAESAIMEGRTKIETEAYGEAFVLFQKALRIAQNAKLIMRAEKAFEIPIGIPSRGKNQDQFEIPIGIPGGNNSTDGDKNSPDDGVIFEIPIGLPSPIKKLPEESDGGSASSNVDSSGGGTPGGNISNGDTIIEIPIGTPGGDQRKNTNDSSGGNVKPQ